MQTIIGFSLPLVNLLVVILT